MSLALNDVSTDWHQYKMTLLQLPIPSKPNLNPHPNTGAILNQGILTEGEGGQYG